MTSKGSLVSLAIVGARFRPPASGILSVLPGGASLLVRREPDNQYDANALQVLVDHAALDEIPNQQLQPAVEGFGFTTNADGRVCDPQTQVELPGPIHLGYIPRIDAELLAPSFDSEGVREARGSLTFDLQGRPCVAFQVPG